MTSVKPQPWLDRAARGVVRGGIAAYRATLGIWMGGHCRYWPTCSQYMLDAVDRHGPWRGTWRGVKRVCRCHPLGGKGYDPA